jgi:hypothetical protein
MALREGSRRKRTRSFEDAQAPFSAMLRADGVRQLPGAPVDGDPQHQV